MRKDKTATEIINNKLYNTIMLKLSKAKYDKKVKIISKKMYNYWSTNNYNKLTLKTNLFNKNLAIKANSIPLPKNKIPIVHGEYLYNSIKIDATVDCGEELFVSILIHEIRHFQQHLIYGRNVHKEYNLFNLPFEIDADTMEYLSGYKMSAKYKDERAKTLGILNKKELNKLIRHQAELITK